MEAAFVILLDSELYNITRLLQAMFFSLYQTKEAMKLEPHITVKYAFPITEIASIERYFDDLTKTTESFEIKVNGINTFDTNVVFLDIVRNQSLRKLHKKILSDLDQKFGTQPAEFEGDMLHFHTTLAYKDVSDTTLQQMKELLKNEKPVFQYQVNKLGLYLKLEEKGSWFIYKVGMLK